MGLNNKKPRFYWIISMGFGKSAVLMRTRVLLVALLTSCSLPALEVRPTMTGFYPLWENTAHVERNGEGFVGVGSAHVGIENIVNLGVTPVLFAYRTPNAYLKIIGYASESLRVSAQVGFFYLLEGAGRSSMSPDYASRLDNPDFTVTLVPAQLVVTAAPWEWVEIHQTLTGTGVYSDGPLTENFWMAYSLAMEILPLNRHAFTFHGTQVGFTEKDQRVFGASYRYRNTWFEGRFGYFYRFREVGTQSGPLLSFGFLF